MSSSTAAGCGGVRPREAEGFDAMFSLILATYGRVDEIGRLLDSLARQTCRDFELIVADQNPDDRVLPYVVRAQQAGWAVQHLRLPTPNLSAARNAGARVATREWLAIPDDDCWYEPETLARVADRLAQSPPVDGLAIHWQEQVHRVPPESDTPLQLTAWRQFKGSDASSITLFLRTATVLKVGGFDERMGVGQWYGAGEETDLLLSLLADGARIERLPSARVHHDFGPRPVASLAAEYRQSRGRARGWGALCAKHRLPGMTILRGLVGPLAWPVARPDGVHGLARAAGVLVGRWQGYFRWRRQF